MISVSAGAVTVTQVGAASGDSLTVGLTAGAALTSLTTSDAFLLLNTTAGGVDTIGTLTDAGGALSVLSISGAGSLSITNPITSATLTTINASGLFGALTLTDNIGGVSFTGSTNAENARSERCRGQDRHRVGSHRARWSGHALRHRDRATPSPTLLRAAPICLRWAGLATPSPWVEPAMQPLLASSTVLRFCRLGQLWELATRSTLWGRAVESVFVGANATVNLGTAATPFAGTANVGGRWFVGWFGSDGLDHDQQPADGDGDVEPGVQHRRRERRAGQLGRARCGQWASSPMLS